LRRGLFAPPLEHKVGEIPHIFLKVRRKFFEQLFKGLMLSFCDVSQSSEHDLKPEAE